MTVIHQGNWLVLYRVLTKVLHIFATNSYQLHGHCEGHNYTQDVWQVRWCIIAGIAVVCVSCRNTRGSLGEMRNAVGNQLHFASTTQCKHRKCFLNSFRQHCEEKRKENHSCTLIVIRTYILFTHKNITSTPHARSHLCF